jgi:hypothetical protein
MYEYLEWSALSFLVVFLDTLSFSLGCQQSYFCKYTGQTGRTFHTRYTEHIQDIQNKRGNIRFLQHILDMFALIGF